MAKLLEGVSDRVLECAKEEFLKKGFMNASLRDIAKNAGTSTGSIYTRFKDKEGLFAALAEPAASELKKLYISMHDDFESMDTEAKHESMADATEESLLIMINYIYDNFDAFYLIATAAYGTKYENYADDFIAAEEQGTMDYLETIDSKAAKKLTVTREFVHMLSTTYYTGILEPIRHRMTREKAVEYVTMFTKYHTAGFTALFDME